MVAVLPTAVFTEAFTEAGGEGRAPDFSPDGTRLILSSHHPNTPTRSIAWVDISTLL